MTDLQLGLVLIGAAAVAAVLIYNRLQERSTRRAAQTAFGSRHADVLLDPAASRVEPTLEQAVVPRPAPQAHAMPDSRIDYIIDLAPQRPAGAARILELWAPLERRFGKRALLAASDGRGWRRLHAGDAGSCVALRAGLQLVSRAGVTSDAEVLEFRSAVESAAAQLKAAISAPEMREALDAARELDRVCAQADIEVALHVLGAFDEASVAGYADQPFRAARRDDRVTFTLDVPRTLEVGRSYESMARAAQHLAGASGGRLVDDQAKTLDQHALAAIGAQLEPSRRLLAERGIEPGSPLALRLFS